MSETGLLRTLTRPPAGAPEGLLVLLHGRGADEHDLFPLLDILDPERRLLGVTPRGPLSLPPGGAHWYRTHQVGFPDPETFLTTLAALRTWLDGLLAEHGLEHRDAVIGGFSQGAVMSYALGLGAGSPSPAAVVGLSGFVPTVEGFSLDRARPGLPVAVAHGTLDPVIGIEWGRDARERLAGDGIEVTYRESPIAHTIDPGVLRELAGWIHSALGRAG